MKTKLKKRAQATVQKLAVPGKLSKRMEAEMGAFIKALEKTPLRNTSNT